MKRPIWKRIKWDNVSLLLATGAVIAAGVWGMYHREPMFDFSKVGPSHVVTYSYRIQEDDTLWTVASDVALPEDDIRKVIFEIMEENKIKDPGKIQPGTVIQISMERKV